MASRWKKPSAAGRRLALDRKFGANVEHYGGPVSLLTLTPPGQDVLPWGDETRLVSGSVGEGNAGVSRGSLNTPTARSGIGRRRSARLGCSRPRSGRRIGSSVGNGAASCRGRSGTSVPNRSGVCGIFTGCFRWGAR